MKTNFKNANEVFLYFNDKINRDGTIKNGTKYLSNISFCIKNPLDNEISAEFRNWKKSYADYEFEWYLSENRSVEDLKKRAKIWDTMHNGDNIVNSNYGYQWQRNNQLQYVVDELTNNKNSRRAGITIYDGKEHIDYKLDTPCTLNIFFEINNDKLDMFVSMRSNDLWFGFCNDQYCFSKLQEIVSEKLNIKIGYYYHNVMNLHLYDNHLNKNQTHNKIKFYDF